MRTGQGQRERLVDGGGAALHSRRAQREDCGERVVQARRKGAGHLHLPLEALEARARRPQRRLVELRLAGQHLQRPRLGVKGASALCMCAEGGRTGGGSRTYASSSQRACVLVYVVTYHTSFGEAEGDADTQARRAFVAPIEGK